MPVCYQFAEKGTCRFGDSCRFEHIPHAPVSKVRLWPTCLMQASLTAKTAQEQKAPKVPKARKVVDQHRPVPDHIVAFFSRYPEFDYDSDLSFIDEFYRMCDHFGWRRYSNERDQARDAMRRAMVQQFNHTFGTNAEDLASWQKLCEIIQIDPIPDKLKQCRRVRLSSSHCIVPPSYYRLAGCRDVPYQYLRSPRRSFPWNGPDQVPHGSRVECVHSGFWEDISERRGRGWEPPGILVASHPESTARARDTAWCEGRT